MTVRSHMVDSKKKSTAANKALFCKKPSSSASRGNPSASVWNWCTESSLLVAAGKWAIRCRPWCGSIRCHYIIEMMLWIVQRRCRPTGEMQRHVVRGGVWWRGAGKCFWPCCNMSLLQWNMHLHSESLSRQVLFKYANWSAGFIVWRLASKGARSSVIH